jgi:hypothetical protein
MNVLYDKGRQGFLDGLISWTSNVIKAVLVDTASYTVNLATDQYLSIIPGGAKLATSSAFTNKTSVAGAADADDLLFPAVMGGSTARAVVIYQDTGDPATSRLIAFENVANTLPLATSGSDVLIEWASYIFKL